MRILVVEDEERIAAFIKRGLEEEAYAVDVCANGETALTKVALNEYDLILLDIMLPDRDGVSFCRELRKQKQNIPILMVTARSGIQDKVRGLDAGADDYLTKPFEFDELLARIRALLRRERSRKTTRLVVEDLELDQITHAVTRKGVPIELTNKEYALLEYFMVHANEVVTRTMISEHVWNEHFDSMTNVIDVHVNYLRNKIDRDFDPPLIHTMRGTGYMLKGELRAF